MNSTMHDEPVLGNGDPEIPPGNPPEAPPQEIPIGVPPATPPEVPEPPGEIPGDAPPEVPPPPPETSAVGAIRHADHQDLPQGAVFARLYVHYSRFHPLNGYHHMNHYVSRSSLRIFQRPGHPPQAGAVTRIRPGLPPAVWPRAMSYEGSCNA
jgi:hypothetical protein